MNNPFIQAASKDAGNRTNYTDLAEWKAAWKAAHPSARNAMSSGSLDYEYCYLPDVDNLNVAGFDHELNKGWVESGVPSNVQAGFFTVEEAREAFRRSLTAVDEEPTTAAPKDSSNYTTFKRMEHYKVVSYGTRYASARILLRRETPAPKRAWIKHRANSPRNT